MCSYWFYIFRYLSLLQNHYHIYFSLFHLNWLQCLTLMFLFAQVQYSRFIMEPYILCNILWLKSLVQYYWAGARYDGSLNYQICVLSIDNSTVFALFCFFSLWFPSSRSLWMFITVSDCSFNLILDKCSSRDNVVYYDRVYLRWRCFSDSRKSHKCCRCFCIHFTLVFVKQTVTRAYEVLVPSARAADE